MGVCCTSRHINAVLGPSAALTHQRPIRSMVLAMLQRYAACAASCLSLKVRMMRPHCKQLCAYLFSLTNLAALWSRAVPQLGPRLRIQRPGFDRRVGAYIAPFPGSDRSVVRRSQMYMAANQTTLHPVQVRSSLLVVYTIVSSPCVTSRPSSLLHTLPCQAAAGS